ncbi:MAG TPA: GAF domain-containing sensor histidine kinase [Gemmatimonadaceae bacterium]
MITSYSGAADDPAGVAIVASLARHLAFAPVAFAVTDGPAHVIRYANAAFRQLLSAGAIAVGQPPTNGAQPVADLTPVLDRAFHEVTTIRDEPLVPRGGAGPHWTCTVWPIPADAAAPEGLVMEVREAALIDGARSRQRAIAERFLLSALREQDVARDALAAGHRATFLASASRDLSMSLGQRETRDAVSRRVLPRAGTWCIVDIVESNGGLHRLAVVHPDPAKQALARSLVDHWEPAPDDSIGAPIVARAGSAAAHVVTHDSGAALIAAAHGPANLAILEQIGFGALLVVPLVVRGSLLGAITFVTPEGDPPFSADEIALASELADRSALALDNARLYHDADVLRTSAEAANRAKSAFLGSMSHELMTPLNAIGGYAELIEMGLRGPVTAEQRTDLTRIKQNQQHLLTLISEILSFVRSESGRMEYHLAGISVRAAVNDVAEMLDGALRAKGLTLDQRHEGGDAVAWADPDRVRQILLNLLMNAIKYSDVPAGTLTVESTVAPDRVLVQVIDSGPGIPLEQLPAIFEPFVQLAAGLTKRQGGVGLGLAISRDLARAMGGDLTVASTPGVGSTFTLSLPRLTDQSES